MTNKIGFHARDMDEFKRVVSIPRVDLVEYKPQKFMKYHQETFYTFSFRDGFKINEEHCEKISSICDDKGMDIQVHLHGEQNPRKQTEGGLWIADRKNHNLLLERFELFDEILSAYGIGTVLTIHPPCYRYKNREIFSEEEALDIGREFFYKVDQAFEKNNWKFKLGVENVVGPKENGASIGYKPEHIDYLLTDTRNIGITMDSGHRILNDEMSMAKLASYGVIVNAHFHMNPGEVHQNDYDDDKHWPATNDLPHYERYLKMFRRRGHPIVLEVDTIDNYTNSQWERYIQDLKLKLEVKRSLNHLCPISTPEC